MIDRKTKEGKLITGLKGKTIFDLTAEERAEYEQYRKKYMERFKNKFAGAIMAQVDDDSIDNLFLYGEDKLKRLYQIKRINF